MSNINRIFIEEILTTIKKIKKLLDGIIYENFRNNNELIEQVIRYLTIIGEASKHISDEVKQEHPDIPWETLLNLRNVFNHPERVDKLWMIATIELAEVKTALTTLK